MYNEHFFVKNDEGIIVAVDFIDHFFGTTERYETYYPGSHIPFKLIGVKRPNEKELRKCNGIDASGKPLWLNENASHSFSE